jgi:hypothetical protein
MRDIGSYCATHGRKMFFSYEVRVMDMPIFVVDVNFLIDENLTGYVPGQIFIDDEDRAVRWTGESLVPYQAPATVTQDGEVPF